MKERFDNLLNKLVDLAINNQLMRSIYKTPWPTNRRSRIITMLGSMVLHLHPTRIPRTGLPVGFTLCLGGISFFLFLIETITGILLMFYYRPEVTHAYQDMKALEFDVPFGILLRNLHRWGAHAMVISVWLHMLRVFLTGSYKPPREFNWVIGVILLTLTLLLSFTGYLLPWDQLSIWAVTVGTNMGKATPVLGSEGPFHDLGVLKFTELNDARFILLGGRFVGQGALLRFYVLHCIALPFVAAWFMAFHFWRVRKDGGISHSL